MQNILKGKYGVHSHSSIIGRQKTVNVYSCFLKLVIIRVARSSIKCLLCQALLFRVSPINMFMFPLNNLARKRLRADWAQALGRSVANPATLSPALCLLPAQSPPQHNAPAGGPCWVPDNTRRDRVSSHEPSQNSLTFPWPFCGFPWPWDILSAFYYCLNTNFASNLTNHSPKVAITK